jgi:hypothetical protein
MLGCNDTSQSNPVEDPGVKTNGRVIKTIVVCVQTIQAMYKMTSAVTPESSLQLKSLLSRSKKRYHSILSRPKRP